MASDPDPTATANENDVAIHRFGAFVIVAMIAITALTFAWIASYSGLSSELAKSLFAKDGSTTPTSQAALQSITATMATLFGSFTTLVGTAIAAYFGISATSNAGQKIAAAAAAGSQVSEKQLDVQRAAGKSEGAADALRSDVKTLLSQPRSDLADHQNAINQALLLLR